MTAQPKKLPPVTRYVGFIEACEVKPSPFSSDDEALKPAWVRGELRTQNDLFRFAGEIGHVSAGDFVVMYGTPETNQQYEGRVKALVVVPFLPLNDNLFQAGLSLWRAEGGTGDLPDFSRALKFFKSVKWLAPEESLSIDQVARLRIEASGFWGDDIRSLIATSSVIDMYIQAQKVGFPKTSMIEAGFEPKIVQQFCATAFDAELEAAAAVADPYSLIGKVDQFTWGDAEKVGVGRGATRVIPVKDERRLAGAILWAVRKITKEGKQVWTTRAEISDHSIDTFGVHGSRHERTRRMNYVDRLLEQKRLVATTIPVIGEVIGTSDLFDAEKVIADFMDAGGPQKGIFTIGADRHDIDATGAMQRMIQSGAEPKTLNKDQVLAIDSFMRHRISVITGPAGSGKTLTISVIVRICMDVGIQPWLLAPTGKAAKRMQELVEKNKSIPSGKKLEPQASTIHMALLRAPKKGSKFDARVVIVDESSMIDSVLMSRLLSFMPDNAALILVGDHNQIPPVSPGAVFRDIVEGERCHVTRLGTVHRNFGVLRRNAFVILEKSKVPPTTKDEHGNTPWTLELVDDAKRPEEEAVRRIEFHYERMLRLTTGAHDVQVLTAENDGPLGVDALNLRLRKVYHRVRFGNSVMNADADDGFFTLDRVIQTKNDYPADIMNGEQGVILGPKHYDRLSGPKQQQDDPLLGWPVAFGDRAQTVKHVPVRSRPVLSYACTVHRYQGSEAPYVIFALWGAHYALRKNTIYTGCTRASQELVLIGDSRGVAKVRKNDGLRRTLLAPESVLLQIKKESPGL